MITLSAECVLHIPYAQSLKEKRMVARSLIDKIRHRFNAAVAETDTQDIHRTLTLGVAVVSGSYEHAKKMMDEVLQFIRENGSAELLSVEFGV